MSAPVYTDPFAAAKWDLVPGGTAVLVIDPQNDFLHEEGWYAQKGIDIGHMRRIVEPTKELVAAARRKHVPVIWTRHGYADAAEAGPLMCAGITTFNALRHSGALPSDLVAVQGIGGLGHLGIQFARNFGYRVAAVGRGPDNAALAKKLGAHVYIDSAATNAAAELQKLGGARVILATAPSSKAMSSLVDGLGMNGRMMVVGATPEPIEVSPAQLIFGKRSLQGWPSGIPTDSEDTLRFAEMTGVRPMIEKYPLAKAAEGYARMMSGRAEFRVVLTM